MSNHLSEAANQNKPMYYIGLMSGTSADGIDLALVRFDSDTNPDVKTSLVAHYYHPYNTTIANNIKQLYNATHNEIDYAFTLDIELAYIFANAIEQFLAQESLSPEDIIAIGNHGQTIRHRPTLDYPFTLQIGCSQTLAILTNIRVVGQFRNKDLALGGQGAPLVPAFHQKIFSHPTSDVFVVNIGGIANMTYLPAPAIALQGKESIVNAQVLGFDTGPGNGLMDEWYIAHHKSSKVQYDREGLWASQGECNPLLLEHFLNDLYFTKKGPKSTGREYFNMDWLTSKLNTFHQQHAEVSASSIQATIILLTASTICNEIKKLSSEGLVYFCGGGVHNKMLMEHINTYLNTDLNKKLNTELNTTKNQQDKPFQVLDTLNKDIDGDQLEAVAFAWLAHAYDHNIPSNMPAVTGARKYCTLGVNYTP
jgi:anhydro-N-acetylmuramic acid kinase